jgi:hypothetical protein
MNYNPEVQAYFDKLDNPLKPLWLEIRDIILGADPKMEEEIKWGAPTFTFRGNLATFNPRAKKFVNLTFHTGALIRDPEGVLEGDAKDARVFRVANSDELLDRWRGLETVVKNWITKKDN